MYRMDRNEMSAGALDYLKVFDRRFRSARIRALAAPARRREAFVHDRVFENDIQAVTFPYVRARGRIPDFANPVGLLEKLRALFLVHPNPLMSLVSDKIAVKRYFDYCGVTTGWPEVTKVFDDPAEIEVDRLPERSIVKVSNSTSMNLVHIPDKPLTRRYVRGEVRKWEGRDLWRRHGELNYRDLERRYFMEEYLPGDRQAVDYKVLCYSGEPYWVVVLENRDGRRLRDTYLTDWTPTRMRSLNLPVPHFTTKRPDFLEQMLEDARKLAQPFLHARIDFMSMNGRLALGEITLCNNALAYCMEPPEAHRFLGDLMEMSTLPDLLVRGRKIAADLGWTTQTSWGHLAGDARLTTGGF